MSLKELREEIEEVDTEIIRIIHKRMEVAARIAGEKEKAGIPVRDPSRRNEVLDRADRLARDLGLDPAAVREIFSILIRMSEHLQDQRRD